jgi:hypothetical protein
VNLRVATARQASDPGGGADLPLGGGAGGALAFLLGYLATFIVQSGDLPERLGSVADALAALGDSSPAGWQVVGWYFPDAHNVGLEVSTSVAGQSNSGTFLSNLGILQMVIPAVLLVLAGLLVARGRRRPGRARGREGRTDCRAGLSRARCRAGTLLLVVVQRERRRSVGERDRRARASACVLLAGVLYPVVFGAPGGAAAGGADV